MKNLPMHNDASSNSVSAINSNNDVDMTATATSSSSPSSSCIISVQIQEANDVLESVKKLRLNKELLKRNKQRIGSALDRKFPTAIPTTTTTTMTTITSSSPSSSSSSSRSVRSLSSSLIPSSTTTSTSTTSVPITPLPITLQSSSSTTSPSPSTSLLPVGASYSTPVKPLSSPSTPTPKQQRRHISVVNKNVNNTIASNSDNVRQPHPQQQQPLSVFSIPLTGPIGPDNIVMNINSGPKHHGIDFVDGPHSETEYDTAENINHVVTKEDETASLLLMYRELHERHIKVLQERDELVRLCNDQQNTLDRLLIKHQDWSTMKRECDFWKAAVEQQIFDSLPAPIEGITDYENHDKDSLDGNKQNNDDDDNEVPSATTTNATTISSSSASSLHTERDVLHTERDVQQQQQYTILQGQIQNLKDLLVSQGTMYENRLKDQSVKTQIATTALETTKCRMVSLHDMVLTLQSTILSQQEQQQQQQQQQL